MPIKANYGVDWDEPIPDSDDCDSVTIPEVFTPHPISEEQVRHLNETYSLNTIVSSAVDLYTELLHTVHALL